MPLIYATLAYRDSQMYDYYAECGSPFEIWETLLRQGSRMKLVYWEEVTEYEWEILKSNFPDGLLHIPDAADDREDYTPAIRVDTGIRNRGFNFAPIQPPQPEAVEIEDGEDDN